MTRQLVGIDGGSIDDRAALLLVGDRGLGEIEHRVDIDLEGQLPFVIGDVFERFETRLMGGIVDENIETAQLGNSLLDHRPALCRIADVARHEDGLASGVLDKAFRLVGVVVFAEIGNQDIGSLARKGNCHRPADAAICAGYDRLLPRELATTPIAILTVVGFRSHIAGATRHGLFLLGEGRSGVLVHDRCSHSSRKGEARKVTLC